MQKYESVAPTENQQDSFTLQDILDYENTTHNHISFTLTGTVLYNVQNEAHTLLQSVGLLGWLAVPFSIILIVVLLFFRISRHFLNSLHGCLNASLQLIRGSSAAISVRISVHFP